MWKSRTIELNTFITLVPSSIAICNSLIQSGLIGGKIQKKDDKTVFTASRTSKRRALRREKATNGTISNETESVPECSLLDQLEKCSRHRIDVWQTHSNAINLNKSVPADCLEKAVNFKNRRNLTVKDWLIATSATEGYSQKYLASST